MAINSGVPGSLKGAEISLLLDFGIHCVTTILPVTL